MRGRPFYQEKAASGARAATAARRNLRKGRKGEKIRKPAIRLSRRGKRRLHAEKLSMAAAGSFRLGPADRRELAGYESARTRIVASAIASLLPVKIGSLSTTVQDRRTRKVYAIGQEARPAVAALWASDRGLLDDFVQARPVSRPRVSEPNYCR
jgi:hypothetical protein